jgi:integrase
MKTLTDADCKNAPAAPPGKRPELRDALVRGLALRVTEHGAKTWILIYNLRGKKTRLMLGSYSAGVTLARARELAKAAKAKVSEGVDVAAAKREVNKQFSAQRIAAVTNSFEYIADRWLANRSAAGKRSLKHDVGRLKNYVYPAWGNRDISTITRRDVFALLEDVQARVIADRGYGTGVNANRVGSLIKSIFAFALDREVITTNPASGVKPLVAEQARKLELSADQTRAAYRATRAISDPRLRDYFTLLWLTGARCGEIAKARWSDVDFNASCLRIPKENTKGKVNWSIPLSEQAMAIIRARKSLASGELIFDGPHL